MKENFLIDKSIAFAARIVKLQQYLIKSKNKMVISKQNIRRGISIGAKTKSLSTFVDGIFVLYYSFFIIQYSSFIRQDFQ